MRPMYVLRFELSSETAKQSMAVRIESCFVGRDIVCDTVRLMAASITVDTTV